MNKTINQGIYTHIDIDDIEIEIEIEIYRERGGGNCSHNYGEKLETPES